MASSSQDPKPPRIVYIIGISISIQLIVTPFFMLLSLYNGNGILFLMFMEGVFAFLLIYLIRAWKQHAQKLSANPPLA